MRPAGLVVAAVALVLGLGTPSAAQPAERTVEAARERWFEAEFEASLAAFDAVLARADLTAADALDAHRYLAALHQLLGDESAARAHADAAVALDPMVEPPDGSPPQARDLFLMARRRLGGRKATIEVEAPAPLSLDTPGQVVARIEPAPAALFERLLLRCGDERADGSPPSVELSVVPRGDLACTAEALTAGGAVLRRTHRTFDLSGPAPGSAETQRGRRVWPWVVAGSIVAAAAVGTVVAVLVARDDGNPNVVGTTVVGW